MGLTGMRNGSKIDKAYHVIQPIKDIMRGQLRKKVLQWNLRFMVPAYLIN